MRANEVKHDHDVLSHVDFPSLSRACASDSRVSAASYARVSFKDAFITIHVRNAASRALERIQCLDIWAYGYLLSS